MSQRRALIRGLALGALWLGGACAQGSPRVAERAPQPPAALAASDGGATDAPPGSAKPTDPVPLQAPALSDAADSAPPDTDAAGDATVDGGPESDPHPQVSIEKPYLTWSRTRPKGDVAAGAHDELLARWNIGGNGDPSFVSNRPGFHPGTRVRVDTRLVRGKLPKSAPFNRRTGKHVVVLSETSLLARSRKYGYWPFRSCFEDGLHRDDALRGGETTLRFVVTTQGKITGERLVKTKLKDAEVASCLVDHAHEIPLLPPSGRIEVELSVQVWPGDAKLPVLDTAPPDALELDASALESVARSAETDLSECYATGLNADPRLWGRLQVHVELTPAGGVRSARERESHFPDPAVTRCALQVLRGLAFPPRKSRPSSFELGVRFGELGAGSATASD